MKRVLLLGFLACLPLAGWCGHVGRLPLPGARSRVLLIGLDGLSSHALRNGAEMPTLRRLMAEGARSLNGRAVVPSGSAANWASLFMCAPPSIHGYVNNTRDPEITPVGVGRNGRFPDVFRAYRDAAPKAVIGFVHEWSLMYAYCDNAACDFVLRTGRVDANVRGFIETCHPSLLSVVFNQPDGTGHGCGWNGKEYFAVLPRLDGYVKDLLDAYAAAGILSNTTVIVTSDHGGKDKSHGGISMGEMERPLVFWGHGVRKGLVLPDGTLPEDLGATIAWLLKVPADPLWRGRPITAAFDASLEIEHPEKPVKTSPP